MSHLKWQYKTSPDKFQRQWDFLQAAQAEESHGLNHVGLLQIKPHLQFYKMEQPKCLELDLMIMCISMLDNFSPHDFIGTV